MHLKLKILLLGCNGFIGSSILSAFKNDYDIFSGNIHNSINELYSLIDKVDIIIHTIGVTRSFNENDFFNININFSHRLFDLIKLFSNKRIIYFSSIHFSNMDLYGFSKRYNEYLFSDPDLLIKNKSFIIRTPGVYGPLAKPNKFSVVSTFCYNIANNYKSEISNPTNILSLIFIDDLLTLIKQCFTVNKNFLILEPNASKICVNDLFFLIKDISIHKKKFSTTDIEFINKIALTYNSFKND